MLIQWFMPKIWKLKSQIPQDVAEKLSEYPPLMRQLLYNRGLTDKHQTADFLNPRYENLHSPFLFKDMQKAVDRIWLAVDRGEKICIYGDYDADAVTANAVLRQTFKYLGHQNMESYIPDRFTEGYGVNLEALEKIKDGGAGLIITVDCGTNSVDAAEFCKVNGIDFIITDHHEIIGPTPDAYALINPKNSEDTYPYHEITGVGVAFKLACGILSDAVRAGAALARPPFDDGRLKLAPTQHIPGWEKWLLDLVAIGTVADCHSLMGENRILVKYGLKVLRKTKWPGLRALAQSSALDFAKNPPDTYTLGFIIAPRLNAAGRLEHADQALDLLLENNLESAMPKAADLETVNRRRQDITQRIVSEAREAALLLGERKILVLSNADWHKGVVGLVAGKLAEEFYKPVIVLEKGELESTGSARTAGNFDVVESLKYASRHLVRFGGHKQAAGLTVKNEHLGIFYQKILEYADKNSADDDSSPVLRLEAELEPTDLSLVTCHLLLQLEPFGIGNPKPIFLMPKFRVISVKLVGKQSSHLQIKFRIADKEVAGIMFSASNFAKNLKIGDTVDIAAELMCDEWNGKKEVKLRIIDLKLI